MLQLSTVISTRVLSGHFVNSMGHAGESHSGVWLILGGRFQQRRQSSIVGHKY